MRALLRVLSFFEQWSAEVLRQPALMFTLVIAPFLLLLAFGYGVKIGGPKPRTIIVQPQGSALPVDSLLQGVDHKIDVIDVTDDQSAAEQRLSNGEADAVMMVPKAPEDYIGRGEHVPIQVKLGEIDPVRRSYARLFLNDQIALLNQQAVAKVLATTNATGNLPGQLQGANAELLSDPFKLDFQDATSIEPTFTSFYSPGVLALLVQHLAITLGALTMSRMRLLHVTDLLQVAPIRTFEIVLGNYLSYAVLCALAAGGLLTLLVLALNVPVLGSYLLVAGAIALLIACSLGIGFATSLVSSSVQQAAQIAMLVLLGSIFFGGFAFSLDRISWPVRVISYFFPATYGIRTLQDVMLRGFTGPLYDYAALAGLGLFFFAASVLLLKRELRPA